MVKFGAQLKDDRVREWSAGYVDYEALKKTLGELVKSGKCQEFSENSVYAAISVATSEAVLKPPGPTENDFMLQVDAEIEKVNRFSEHLRTKLDEHVARIQAEHDAWSEAGRAPSQIAHLRDEVSGCEQELQRFEDYINLNYMAFSKILKKHDKLSTCPCRMPYLLRIQSQTFTHDKMTHAIKGISDMSASLAGAAVVAGAGAFDPNQAGGASFVRRTTKYWVQTKDVLKVKMYLLKHLPIYKFTDGATDGDLVSSVYFDSDSHFLYQGRLKKFDGAIALRIRWYGPEEGLPVAFVERKTHREDWWGDGEASAKERFPLREGDVVPFLEGRLSPEAVGEWLRADRFKGDVDAAVQLAREVQDAVRKHGLRPALRTHYMRTAFQRTGDAQVRCSLDTELCMALEHCKPGQWKREGPLSNLNQVTQFPHAVLEVKLQVANLADTPQWVTDLLGSGYLREVPKFSKFVHGTAYLNRNGQLDNGSERPAVREQPYWWSDDWKPLWVNGQVSKSRPLPVGMLSEQDTTRQMNFDEIPAWFDAAAARGAHENALLRLTVATLQAAAAAARGLFAAVVTCQRPGSAPSPPAD